MKILAILSPQPRDHPWLLHDMPLGWGRFNRYIQTVIGAGDDVALMPLVAMNRPFGSARGPRHTHSIAA